LAEFALRGATTLLSWMMLGGSMGEELRASQWPHIRPHHRSVVPPRSPQMPAHFPAWPHGFMKFRDRIRMSEVQSVCGRHGLKIFRWHGGSARRFSRHVRDFAHPRKAPVSASASCWISRDAAALGGIVVCTLAGRSRAHCSAIATRSACGHARRKCLAGSRSIFHGACPSGGTPARALAFVVS